MFTIVFMDHVFVFKTKEELKVFLDMLFTYSTDRRILYMTIADAMSSWLVGAGIHNDSGPLTIDTLIDSMLELYIIYGVIYDPDGQCFTVVDGKLNIDKEKTYGK